MKCPTGKIGHPTREAAVIARRHVKKVLNAYRCPKCKKWHLGNTDSTHLANMNRLFAKVAQRESGRIKGES